MKILFLGPACEPIENHLLRLGHTLIRQEEPLQIPFLEKSHFDFCVSYRYKHILAPVILDYFPDSVINLHISLLPWNRGSDPNFWSFIENTPKGVTIHKIDQGIDTGDILLQRELSFDTAFETLRTTYVKLARCIENLFVDNVERLLAKNMTGQPQGKNGSFHYATDKEPYLYLLEDFGWDTPVSKITGAKRKTW